MKHEITNELLKSLEPTQVEIKAWVETTLNAYLTKNNEYDTSLATYEHVLDYLKSDAAPKRLRKMSVKQAKESAARWTKALEKRGNNIKEDTTDIKIVKKFKNGFNFVQLVGKAAFEREGAQMRHCVASYFGKTNTEVYSLRDPLNNAHCTIEVQKSGDSKNINQIKGKGNGHIHPDYIGMVIDVLKYFKMEVRDSELSNLGYIYLDAELEKLTKKLYKDLKTFKFNKKTYLYQNQNFSSKELNNE